jgi:hypothetical protein
LTRGSRALILLIVSNAAGQYEGPHHMAPNATLSIRPGLLIALRSTVRGGVNYTRVDLESDKEDVVRWETARTITDPKEHALAQKARSNAVAQIRGICVPTSFGLLCPADREAELDAGFARAIEIRDGHNAEAKTTVVELHMLKGRIAATDEQAVGAINAELSVLINELQEGVTKLSPETIRAAATRARELSAMLSPEREKIVTEAVTAARLNAREIVRRIDKGGEEAAVVLMDMRRGAIERARVTFLDLEETPAQAALVLPAVAVQRFADVADDAPQAANDHAEAV